MKRIRLHTIPADKPFKQIALNDGLPDKQTVMRDTALTYCLLRDKHLKGITFTGGRIAHCRFEHTNLRDSRFERVDLTGTEFYRCNLRHVQFSRCDLRYTSFDNCELDYDAVLLSAPPESNLRQELLRTLRCNAISMGDTRQAERLLALELIAEREELWNRIVSRTEHHRKRYVGWDRVTAARQWLIWWCAKLFLGHGLALGHVAAAGAAVIAGFAILCFGLPAEYRFEGAPGTRRLGLMESFYYSTMCFTNGGFGDIMPGNSVARLITSVEGLVGVVFLGFFAAAAYRRLSR